MFPMLQSGHLKPSHKNRLVGNPLVTMTSTALIVIALLVASCGLTTTQISTSRSPATATPTSAVLPAAPLAWTAGSLPPGNAMFSWFGSYNSLSSLSIAPGDGDTAYSCIQPQTASVGPAVWVTHDHAQHWMPLTALPPVGQQLTICDVMPDAVDPSILAAAVSWVQPKDLMGAPPQVFVSDFTSFVTFDGGVHWQLFHGPESGVLDWLATYQGTTVAMLDIGSGNVNLWSSTDQMQTWNALSQAPYGRPWINPATGELLVVGQTSSGMTQIYESSDLGQQWTSFLTPIATANMTPVVSPPEAGQSWTVCGLAGVESVSPFSAGTLMCSLDSGRTWTMRPQLITTFDNPYKGTFPQAANVVAVAPDGTVYAMLQPSQWPMPIQAGLYRLMPQASRWQPLGLPPGDAVDTVTIPGAGILWEISGEDGTSFAGPFPS